MVPYEVDDEVSGLKAKMFDAVWVRAVAVQKRSGSELWYNYFAFAAIDQNLTTTRQLSAVNDGFLQKRIQTLVLRPL